MQAPEEIEAILSRLMPTAMSQTAQEEIEAIFGPEEISVKPAGRKLLPFLVPISVAAAAAVALAFLMHPRASAVPGTTAAVLEPEAGVVLVGASDRIESMTDEGMQDTPEGDAVHSVRLQVVEENTLQDEETGIVMMVSEPREEWVLVPVTTF